MRRRPLHTVLAFVIVGVSAVIAVLLVANVLFSGPSSATLEANAVSACESNLTGGFEVGDTFAEADHRDEIKAASFTDGAFRPDHLVSENETVYYVTGTGSLGSGNAELVCTTFSVDGGAVMTQYEPAKGTWLG